MADAVVAAVGLVEEDAVVAGQRQPAHLRHLRLRQRKQRQRFRQLRRQPQRTHLPLVAVGVVVAEHRAPTVPKAGSNTPRLTSS